jgi:four helix bundle protein
MPDPKPHPFDDLRVFHSSVAFAEAVYRLTESFPGRERFGLTSQLRRAAVSVVANIAEGRARLGPRAFAAHLDIAHGSVREVQSLLLLSSRLGMLPELERESVDDAGSKVAAELLALLHWLRRRPGAARNT